MTADQTAGQIRRQPVRHSFSDPFQHAVDDAAPRALQGTAGRVPGEVGIWVFIGGDLLIFGTFFVVFVLQRAEDPWLFGESRETLNLTFGAVNTLLLLTGSMFVVQALHALRRQASRLARWMLGLAMVCGSVFAVDKVFEYTAEIQAGHTPSANEFYSFYFMFTGLHLLHLFLALGFLAIALRITFKPVPSPRDAGTIEAAACFWHLIDLLWIVLFALLYLLR